ncbi:hypothetical protein QAD02_004078 [Eretmocerus hayati]|uniref:Uncharacterized protein n=1 Tax=Eretmocerus hayati TaxID=131215 RepID=A0ACC2NNR8_9HYME|nr:hypothetical protein QAD02_004078 [Eretmocerus hayati]
MLRAQQSARLKKKNYNEKVKILRNREEGELQDSNNFLDRPQNLVNTISSTFNEQDSSQHLYTDDCSNANKSLFEEPSSTNFQSSNSFLPQSSYSADNIESTHVSQMQLSDSDSGDSEAVDTSDEEEDPDDGPLDILRDITDWALKHPIAKSELESLLKVLNRHHKNMPKSAKTLLKQPDNKKYTIEKVSSVSKGVEVEAECVYFGILEYLLKTVNPDLHEDSELDLGFNVDGVTLYHSSSKEFWVTSGKVYTKKDHYKPFPISVHCGKGKPADWNAYFEKFITEMNSLLENGIVIAERKFTIKIKCFCCDKPARSYIKNVKGHGGYFACEVCMVEGHSINKTVYYPMNCAPLRTDASFRNRENPGHHHGDSALEKISHLDMIDDFMNEFMHQGCLGNMKKISMDHWFKSKKKILTKEQKLIVSQRLMNLSSQIPWDFQRTTRSLAEMSLWKATEWRFFLFYAAVLIMKDILPDEMYRHFMLLSTGCLILDSESFYETHIEEAEQFLNLFCETAAEIYGPEIETINLHNTSHLARDVKNKKLPLTALAAFCYENLYGEMKKSIRSGNKPLQQLCNRYDGLTGKKPELEPDFKLLQIRRCQDGSMKINKIKYKNCDISNTKPNNLVLLKSGEIMRIKSMESCKKTQNEEKIILKGDKVKIVGPAYEYPCDSSIFNRFKIVEKDNSEKIEEKLINVECKMFSLSIYEFPEDGEIDSYAMPLIHSK